MLFPVTKLDLCYCLLGHSFFCIEVGHTLVYSMHQSFVTTVLYPLPPTGMAWPSTQGGWVAFYLQGWGGLPSMEMGWLSTYGDGYGNVVGYSRDNEQNNSQVPSAGYMQIAELVLLCK